MKDKPLGIKEASVSFGSIEVFHDLSLEISKGEFVAVVGPSGCGKTTLLNLFSGFLKPSFGSVACAGRVRMVYQHDSLFPWQTAAQNIALGLRDLTSEAERERQYELEKDYLQAFYSLTRQTIDAEHTHYLFLPNASMSLELGISP